jgi:hypothetical protein
MAYNASGGGRCWRPIGGRTPQRYTPWLISVPSASALYSARDSVGGGPYLVEADYPLQYRAAGVAAFRALGWLRGPDP